MSDRTRSELIARRGEILAELLLQDLGAEFVARPTTDLGYDLLAGFPNTEGGINMAAVEVKVTERDVGGVVRLRRTEFQRLARSNIPSLLLVVNVKDNRLFYSMPASEDVAGSRADSVTVPVTPIDAVARDDLRALLAGAPEAAMPGTRVA